MDSSRLTSRLVRQSSEQTASESPDPLNLIGVATPEGPIVASVDSSEGGEGSGDNEEGMETKIGTEKL